MNSAAYLSFVLEPSMQNQIRDHDILLLLHYHHITSLSHSLAPHLDVVDGLWPEAQGDGSDVSVEVALDAASADLPGDQVVGRAGRLRLPADLGQHHVLVTRHGDSLQQPGARNLCTRCGVKQRSWTADEYTTGETRRRPQNTPTGLIWHKVFALSLVGTLL